MAKMHLLSKPTGAVTAHLDLKDTFKNEQMFNSWKKYAFIWLKIEFETKHGIYFYIFIPLVWVLCSYDIPLYNKILIYMSLFDVQP